MQQISEDFAKEQLRHEKANAETNLNELLKHDKNKVGDLVVCHYQFHVGIGYAKVIKIFDCEKGREVEEYGPVIKHHGDNNSKLDITVQILGYDLRLWCNLGEDISEDTSLPSSFGKVLDANFLGRQEQCRRPMLHHRAGVS